MYITVNGVQLYYEKNGEGRPLLLVHGNGEDHTIFDEAAAVLKENYTCYAIDSRGHGLSSGVDVLHYEDMADDLAAFIEALDLQDVIYYGFSDGGILGLLTALRTDRIKDMIISGTNLSPKGARPLVLAGITLFADIAKDPKYIMMRDEPDIDPTDLHHIHARTLVLAGENDVIKESETLKIYANIPYAEVKILPQEGHGSYIVHSTKIAELIDSFVKGGKRQ